MSSSIENQEEAPDTERYRIGDLLIDVDARRVLRADQEIHLTELSFDVLVVLLRHAPNVVSRQQLMVEVWLGVIVEPDTVKKRVSLLRESLEDDAQQEPLIRIVRGRGCAISEPVERFEKNNQQSSPNEMMGIPGMSLLATDGNQYIHNKDIDPLAFEAYLDGTMLLRSRGRAASGITALERAIDIEPSFAAAHAVLSLSRMGNPCIEWQRLKNVEICRKAAQRALELDPQLPLAYLAVGAVALILDLNMAGAEAMLQKGLSFEPNNRHLLSLLGYLAMIRGEFDTAIKLARSFVVDNPSDIDRHYNLGQNYYIAGHYREAINAYRRAMTLDPDMEFAHLAIGRVRALQGDSEASLKHMEQETSLQFRPYCLVIAHTAAGDEAAADEALEEFIAKSANDYPYWTGTLLAYRGEVDSAFEFLELAYSMRDAPMLEIKVDPLLRSIRKDPRYTELVNRMKFD